MQLMTNLPACCSIRGWGLSLVYVTYMVYVRPLSHSHLYGSWLWLSRLETALCRSFAFFLLGVVRNHPRIPDWPWLALEGDKAARAFGYLRINYLCCILAGGVFGGCEVLLWWLFHVVVTRCGSVSCGDVGLGTWRTQGTTFNCALVHLDDDCDDECMFVGTCFGVTTEGWFWGMCDHLNSRDGYGFVLCSEDGRPWLIKQSTAMMLVRRCFNTVC